MFQYCSSLRATTDLFLARSLCGNNISHIRANFVQVLPSETASSAFEVLPLSNRRTTSKRNKDPIEFDDGFVFKMNTISPKHFKPRNSRSFVDKLFSEAETHAQGHQKEIYLLLVTSSYNEIFMNFICHVKALHDMPNDRMFLVLTPHQDIIGIAKGAGFGTVWLNFENTEFTSTFSLTDMSDIKEQSGADFGTILYQRMIYIRTYTALLLLKAGFNPIIIDIDTVWLRNPLSQSLVSKDIIVTLDGGEICGCFVYLNSTESTISFWESVVSEHYDLVQDNRINDRNHSGHMSSFFDSEQKILTDFILHGKYRSIAKKNVVKVYTLPTHLFLNGLDYFLSNFNEMRKKFETYGLPAVIHNNFIIGHALKKNRFQRFGLWRLDTWGLFRNNIRYSPRGEFDNDWITKYVYDHDSISDTLYCSCAKSSKLIPPFEKTFADETSAEDTVITRWVRAGVYHAAFRNAAARSLLIVLPLYNEMEHGDEYLKTMVMAEGIGHTKGKLFTSRSYQYIEFHNSFFVGELSYDFDFTTFTVEFSSVGFTEHVDIVGGNNVEKSVSIDLSYKNQDLADERVRNSSSWVLKWEEEQLVATTNLSCHASSETTKGCHNRKSSLPRGVVRTSHDFSFQIQVITFNRPSSLQRLLDSLLRADYGEGNDVLLCILVDYPSQKATVNDVSSFLSSMCNAGNDGCVMYSI